MYYLTVLSGSQAGQRKKISADELPRLLVGQANQCDWVLNEKGVQSLHCLIEATRVGVTVVALLGGISVNGNGLDHRTPVPITVGDIIEFSDSEIQVVLSETPDRSIESGAPVPRGKLPIRLPVFGIGLIMVGASCYALVGQNPFSDSPTLPQMTELVSPSIPVPVPTKRSDTDGAQVTKEALVTRPLQTLQDAFRQSDLIVPENRIGEASLVLLQRFEQIATESQQDKESEKPEVINPENLIQPMVAVKVGEHPFLTDSKGAVYFLNSRLPNGDLLVAIDSTAYTVENEGGRYRYSSAHLQVLQDAQQLVIAKLALPKAAEFRGKRTSKYDHLILKASETYGIDAYLIKAVIQTESNFDPHAVSHVGAQGLMQIMPTTAKGLDLIHPFSPEHNIMAGSKLLSRLLNKYEHNLDLALAAYNAGEGAVSKYNGVPPYKETMAYVEKVSQALDQFRNTGPESKASIQLTLKEQDLASQAEVAR